MQHLWGDPEGITPLQQPVHIQLHTTHTLLLYAVYNSIEGVSWLHRRSGTAVASCMYNCSRHRVWTGSAKSRIGVAFVL